MKKKIIDFLDSSLGFLWMNWYLIPVAVCFYGLVSKDYDAMQFSLEANIVLWLTTSGVAYTNLKQRDRKIKELHESMETLCNMIENKSEKNEK
jgi:hypothetical protein